MDKDIKYRGQAIDRLGILDTRQTKWYTTYKEAHDAASKIAKKYFSNERYNVNVITNKD